MRTDNKLTFYQYKDKSDDSGSIHYMNLHRTENVAPSYSQKGALERTLLDVQLMLGGPEGTRSREHLRSVRKKADTLRSKFYVAL